MSHSLRSRLRVAPARLACVLLLAGPASLLACSSSPSNDASGATATAAPSSSAHDPGSPATVDPTLDPATAIVVGVDAEAFQSQGFHISVLEIVARVEGVEVAREKVVSVPLFPHELRLHAPKDKPNAVVDLEIVIRERIEEGAPPLLTRRATTTFVKGTTKLAYVLLEVRCNTGSMLGGSGLSGPTCTGGMTCVGGACVSAELPPLADYRADWAESPPSACGEGAPELTLAKGQTALAPLADGEALTLEQGIQCGHHVWLALRMKNLAQSGTTTVLSATQPGSGVTVPATAFPFVWSPSIGGACDLVGVRFQLDVSGAKASDFLGKPLDIKVEARDKAGRSATAIRHVTIAPTIIPSVRDCSFAQ